MTAVTPRRVGPKCLSVFMCKFRANWSRRNSPLHRLTTRPIRRDPRDDGHGRAIDIGLRAGGPGTLGDGVEGPGRLSEVRAADSGRDAGEGGARPGSGWSTRPAVLRALAHRDFRLFFGGQLVSLIGTWMQSVAQAWLVYRLTGSSVLLGLVGFAGQFPVFLLSPLGGSLADSRSRHRIIIATQTAAMVLAFALAG